MVSVSVLRSGSQESNSRTSSYRTRASFALDPVPILISVQFSQEPVPSFAGKAKMQQSQAAATTVADRSPQIGVVQRVEPPYSMQCPKHKAPVPRDDEVNNIFSAETYRRTKQEKKAGLQRAKYNVGSYGGKVSLCTTFPRDWTWTTRVKAAHTRSGG